MRRKSWKIITQEELKTDPVCAVCGEEEHILFGGYAYKGLFSDYYPTFYTFFPEKEKYSRDFYGRKQWTGNLNTTKIPLIIYQTVYIIERLFEGKLIVEIIGMEMTNLSNEKENMSGVFITIDGTRAFLNTDLAWEIVILPYGHNTAETFVFNILK